MLRIVLSALLIVGVSICGWAQDSAPAVTTKELSPPADAVAPSQSETSQTPKKDATSSPTTIDRTTERVTPPSQRNTTSSGKRVAAFWFIAPTL